MQSTTKRFTLPEGWTPIATRPRVTGSTKKLLWNELPDAWLKLEDARALAEKGMILMASRFQPDCVEVVVKAAQSGADCVLEIDNQRW